MDPLIISAFHSTAKLTREAIFDSDQLMPITALGDANTAAPGWVGPDWMQGTLLIGINPGGGGDQYRRNPSDDELYGLLRAFRTASSRDEQSEAFHRLCAAWLRIQKGHNIWRVIDAILNATGETPEQIAFINVLPFRTRMDKMAPSSTIRKAWDLSTRPAIRALQPKRIIALGKKAWDVMERQTVPEESEVILFKRGIGDSYIPEDSKAVLRALTAQRLHG